ncbi:uncharacterized protein LOC127095484 [Lathyrus oleraceus]|uniref:uncharacterized protein LOC127095484 n=1 Tax=Pisum sativum TaxID=3888 RepID=UPI0021D20398|nr:uncharacterized protein LOC127095484 [Pisum sativum]
MRITRLVNQVKECKETVMEQYVVAKILCYLTPRYDNVVVAIEESKDLVMMSKKELQSSIEAHEQRMEERNSDKENEDIALQARFNKKDKRLKGKWHVKSKGNFHNFGGREYQNSKNSTCRRGDRRCNKNGGQGNFRGEKKRFDKSNEYCFKYKRFNHFAKDCNANKKDPQGDEAKVARQEFDKENTLLVMITKGYYSSNNHNSRNSVKLICDWLHDMVSRLHAGETNMMGMKRVQCNEEWYLDSGYSTHMTGRKDWFVKINRAMKKKVKFTNDTTLAAYGIGDVLIMRSDSGYSLIKYVLYFLGIKSNLISIGQLLWKGYKTHMENKGLHVMDEDYGA